MTRFAALLLVVALVAVASAQVPTVVQSTALFDQNGGVLTVYGTGFIQRNLDQFKYTLVTGAGSPCAGGCPFFCHYHSMVVNPAGTITYCEVPYIPDGTLGPTGSNYITLAISNANGATVNPVTVAVINAVPTQITPSTSNAIPPFTTGLTLTGVGFPSENSIFSMGTAPQNLASYTLTLTDNTNLPGPPPTPIVATIDLVGYRSKLGLTNAPLAFWAGNAPNGQNAIVRYTKTQIDIYYFNQAAFGAAATGWVFNNNVNGLFATLSIVQQFPVNGAVGANYGGVPSKYTDTVGPVQIGVIVQNVAPTITPIPIVAPYSPASFLTATDPFLTISAANLLQYPVVNSNIFVPSPNGGAGPQDLRCDTVSVNLNIFVCALSVRPIAYQTTALSFPPPAADIITGKMYSSSLVGNANVAQPVAIINTAGLGAGNTAFKFPINPATSLPDPTQPAIPAGITPDDQPIQQDALTLSFTSASGSFYPPDLPYLYEYALSSALATLPQNIVPTITITGLYAGGGAMTCTAIYPDQVEPNANPLKVFTVGGTVGTAVMGQPQSVPSQDACNIVSITNSKVVVKIANVISAPVGTVVSASFTATATVGGALKANPAQPIGIVAPGAGVGGDPHFFGFLGEKYEFAGEAGRVYNLLTDDEIQLNAEIGYWHWNRGKETIIRKLALKTNDHRVLIDAGGNHLGTEGFSISVDGASIPPSRTRQTYLGAEGWIRWYPLSPDDKFRLPLWERHQGVALVEILLNDYKFQVLAVEEGKDKNGEWHQQPSRFLDFMAEMITNRRPHGLFGQSAHLRANQRSAADFSIEGQGTDYEVSNLFGDDFTFNKFGSKK